jgi:hypothetical protein
MNGTKKMSFQIRRGPTPLKYLLSGKPEVEKFQNRVEMKVNYPTNKENTLMDFSHNFHNIKNFVQVDGRLKISKNSFIFPFFRSRKIVGDRKIFPSCKNKHI